MTRLVTLIVSSLLAATSARAGIASAPPFVGTWARLTTCAELVAGLRNAGMQKWVREFVAGNGFVPGVTSAAQVSGAAPCKGAVSRRHSHVFTRTGGFRSRDRIALTPVVARGCLSFRCAWAISMAYPGKTWRRVR